LLPESEHCASLSNADYAPMTAVVEIAAAARRTLSRD
jgi:hypothetical protein